MRLPVSDAPIRIQRVHHERDFTVIGNAAIQDPDLSFKATGLLCYLLSLPPDWRVNLADLTNRKTEGRDAIRSAFAELEELRYVRRSQVREGSGRFVEWLVVVSEIPMADLSVPETASPATFGFSESGSPDFGSPDFGKPDATKNPLPSNDTENQEHTRLSLRLDPERCPLDEVIALWPRPGELANRYNRRWKSHVAKAGGPMDMAVAVSVLVNAWEGAPQEQREQFCPSLRTWLEEERYLEGTNQQGPRPTEPELGSASPIHPSDVPAVDGDGNKIPDDVYAAAVTAAEQAWTAHHGSAPW